MFYRLHLKVSFYLAVLTFLIPQHGWSSDDAAREVFRTFFRSVLNHSEEGIPKPILDITNGLMLEKDFKKTESFQEVLCPDGRTKWGYITIGFALPGSHADTLIERLPNFLADYTIPPYPQFEDSGEKNQRFQIGMLSGELSARPETKLLNLKIQVYRDTRQNHLYNFYRINLPTALSHLNATELKIFLCHALHGYVVEWMVLARKDDQLAKSTFGLLIQQNLGMYLSECQSELCSEWVLAHKLLEGANSKYRITYGFEDHEDSPPPSMEAFVKQIAVYNQIMALKPMKDALAELSVRIKQINCLMGPSTEEVILSLLYFERNGPEKKLEFAFGMECLPLYFSRLRQLSSPDREKECAALINHRFAFLPELLRLKDARFIAASSSRQLAIFVPEQLSKVQSKLIEMRKQIHEISPTTRPLEVKAAKESYFTSVTQAARGDEKEAESRERKGSKNVFDRLPDVMRNFPFLAFFSGQEMPGYPRMVEKDSAIYMVFPSKNAHFRDCIDECNKVLPCSNQKAGQLKSNDGYAEGVYSDELRADCIYIKPTVLLGERERKKLREVWVTFTMKHLKDYVCSDTVNQVSRLSEYFEALNQKLIQRLCLISDLLGFRLSDKKTGLKLFQTKLEPMEKINAYLFCLEQMPKEIFTLLNNPEANTELYKITLDVMSIRSFETLKSGALKFVAENNEKLSSHLLAIFADCYLTRHREASKGNPLGAAGDVRLAKLLGIMLLNTVKEKGSAEASGFVANKKYLDSFLPIFKESLEKLKEFDFKVE